jgi:hypothetical protein
MIRLVAVFVFLIMSASLHATPLADYRWKNRLVLWQSASAEFRAELVRTWEAVAAECAERDVLVLRIETPELREAVGVPVGDTVVLLVGKDGGVKERWSRAVAPEEVFALIDEMPMRRAERRE